MLAHGSTGRDPAGGMWPCAEQHGHGAQFPCTHRHWAGWNGKADAVRAPTFAAMILLSANGTLRTILILLIVWQALRIWMRAKADRPQRGGHMHWTNDRPRAKGELRIERLDEVQHGKPPPNAEDADFEVIKDKPEH